MSNVGTIAGDNPRLLLLRDLRSDLPPFLTAHFAERVRCLEQSFTVVEHAGGGDLSALCDASRPDLIMLEVGADTTWPPLTNLTAHPDVPRVGFLNADPFDVARAAFAAACEKLGVRTYFTHSVSMGEYTPEFVDRLFFWPNFVEPDVFHPYDEPKTTDVLFSGSQAALYPWRSRTRALLEARYPSAAMEHFGWSGSAANRMPAGVDYARILAAGRFVPACGAIGREVVRKHLEVPAVGTCLIAEASESLKSFGFIDMENSILGDGPELFEKIDHLLTDAEAYARVTAAGAALVSSRHTIAHRTQVHDWFLLEGAGHTDDELDQDGPTGHVRLRTPDAVTRDRVIVSDGVDRRHLRAGWQSFVDGDIAAAAASFERCLTFTYIAEAVIGVTMCRLAVGQAAAAEAGLRPLWDLMAEGYGQLTPDPVVIATMIRVRLCQGDVTGAVALSREHAAVTHLELDRIRSVLFSADHVSADDGRTVSRSTPSICPLPPLDDQRWRADLTAMLAACGRGGLVTALSAGVPLAQVSVGRTSRAVASVRRALDRTVRAGLAMAKETVRRTAQPLKRRWSATPWAADLAEVIHATQPPRLVLVGARLTSVPQRVLGWIVWSTDIQVSGQPHAAAGTASPPVPEMLYLAGSAVRSFDVDSDIGASTRIVVLEHARRVPAERLAALGFSEKNSAPEASRPIRVFVR